MLMTNGALLDDVRSTLNTLRNRREQLAALTAALASGATDGEYISDFYRPTRERNPRHSGKRSRKESSDDVDFGTLFGESNDVQEVPQSPAPQLKEYTLDDHCDEEPPQMGALCFAALEMGGTSPFSMVSLAPLHNLSRIRPVTVSAASLAGVESDCSQTSSVVGGIRKGGCWGESFAQPSKRISIPVGALDPFSSHLLLGNLNGEGERKKTRGRQRGGAIRALKVAPLLATSLAEVSTLVAAERLFPSPYRGPRGHGLLPSVLPREHDASGMKALSRGWSVSEDDALMQAVLAFHKISASTIDLSTGPNWVEIAAGMESSFGSTTACSNAQSCWLRWENVLRPLVEAAATGTQWCVEDGTCRRRGQNEKDELADEKGAVSQQVEGSQRLRGLDELFLGCSCASHHQRYQSAAAWPAHDDNFLWALAREANFKLDRAFWLEMKFVAPLKDSYAPFAVLQRFQQLTNPVHCTPVSGSVKAVLKLRDAAKRGTHAGANALHNALTVQRTREVLESCHPAEDLHPLYRKRSTSLSGPGGLSRGSSFDGSNDGVGSPLLSQCSTLSGRATHITGWTGLELHTLLGLANSYLGSEVDSWFGVDLLGIHVQYTTLCLTQQPSTPTVMGNLLMSNKLQLRTREQVRGVLRSLKSAIGKE